jgi:hypothetical protein
VTSAFDHRQLHNVAQPEARQPEMSDIPVPTNMKVGLHHEEIACQSWAVTAHQALTLAGLARHRADRSARALQARATRYHPGGAYTCYTSLQANIALGGKLHEIAKSTSKQLLFFCAFAERSAVAVQATQDTGSLRPATSRAASTLGRRLTTRWRAEELGQCMCRILPRGPHRKRASHVDD